jgi:hypothetical protein
VSIAVKHYGYALQSASNELRLEKN